jgi:hypothetical protein
VLFCAPSNTAADLFATELLQAPGVDPNMVFRLYALMQPVHELKESLRHVSCVTSVF